MKPGRGAVPLTPLPRLQDQMPTSTNAIYQAAARLWKPWLQQEALSTLSRGEEVQDACRRDLLPAWPAHPA